MKDEVIIISPEVTPGVGGLADYTLRVVEEWGDEVSVRFIQPDELPSSRAKVLLQYSAYGFSRIGYPRSLLRGLVEWKRATPGALLVVMFHEIWTFWPLLNKNRFVQALHRADIRKLLAVADAVFTSTPSQADYLRALAPAGAIEIMPVGSNIRPLARFDQEREDGLAVLFGLQGARLRSLREMQRDLASLAEAKRITKIIAIGKTENARATKDEERLLSELHLAGGFELRGALSEKEVSTLLARASFGISAQPQLSLTKSGTLMAYAAHGLNIISPAADQRAPEPFSCLTSPGQLLHGISAEELERDAANLRAWQEHTSSWPQIAARFAQALRLGETTAA